MFTAVIIGGKVRNHWEYSDSPQPQGWEFEILKKKNFVHVFESFFEKITKNVISRKLERFEPSHLETRFATSESTLIAPNYRLRIWNIEEKKFHPSFRIFFWKSHKKRRISKNTMFTAVIIGGKVRNHWEYSDSPQLQGWEFEILKKKNFVHVFESFFWKNHKKRHLSKTRRIWAVTFGDKIRNLREYSDSPQLQVENLKHWRKKISSMFLKIFLKKSQKTSYLENYKDLSRHIWRQDSQFLRVLWQYPITGLGICKWEFVNYFVICVFLKIFEKKITKIVVSRTLKGFEHP